MPENDLRAAWTSADAYDRYSGRWSRAIAPRFISWLGVPAGASWLDVGCGPGTVTEAILREAGPARIAGLDRSAAYVAEAERRFGGARVSFQVGEATALPCQPDSFDAVVSGLLLNFLPDPEGAVREMARVCRAGGTVAAYVWDYLGGMEVMRVFWDVAAEQDPGVRQLPEGQRYPFCRPAPLQAVFRGAGLDGIEVTAIEAPADFAEFEDYWQPFLGAQGTAPTYVASLSEDRREELKESLRATLSVAEGGQIHLKVKAWAVRGVTRSIG